MWAFIASFLYWVIALTGIAALYIVVGAVVARLFLKWLDYADGHSESRLTDRLNDTLERELAEYGASEGNDGRHA